MPLGPGMAPVTLGRRCGKEFACWCLLCKYEICYISPKLCRKCCIFLWESEISLLPSPTLNSKWEGLLTWHIAAPAILIMPPSPSMPSPPTRSGIKWSFSLPGWPCVVSNQRPCSDWGVDWGCNPIHSYLGASPIYYNGTYIWVNMYRIGL